MRKAPNASILIALSVCITGCATLDGSSDISRRGWQDLFDGQTLDGWVPTGNADAWRVENGEIVVTDAGGGGWLRTDRTYRDFELELDFWLPEGGNSGVGLRGSSSGDPAFSGFEVQILDTFGEAPGDRNCGAVYEAIPANSMAVNAPGEWNTYRIRLIGDSLDVWLNGEHIHDQARLDERGYFRDPGEPLPLHARATTGYIALQDHAHPVRFRNIRIRDLSPNPEPKDMRHLIGTSLADGWFTTGGTMWSIEDGTLIGQGGPGHIFTTEEFDDFELRALVWVNPRGNSGMYFRTHPNSQNRDSWPEGYEAQVDNHDPKNFTGCLYDVAWAAAPVARDEAWFDYRIVAKGDRIRTWINGVPMVDERLDRFRHGHIALQGHHPGNVIMYKDVRIKEL